MRLLIWCSTISFGGGNRLLTQLVSAFLRSPEIDKVGLAIPESAEKIFRSVENQDKLQIIRLPRLQRRQWNSFAFAPGVRRALEVASYSRANRRLQSAFDEAVSEFDVVYCYWGQTEPYVKSARPAVVTVQDLTAVEFPEILGESVTEKIRSDTSRWLHSGVCVVSSEAMRDKVKALFPKEDAKLVVVPHAISPVARGGVSQESLLPELPTRFLIYPANLNSHKNHYNLFIAIARWSQRAAIPLVLVGEGTDLLHRMKTSRSNNWQVSRLKSLIARKNLREGVDFLALGYVNDAQLATLIAKSWGLVMPSLAEGGGSFPVEEALNSGIPVACSDIAVMREHLSKRSAEIVWFDAECPASIAHALDCLNHDYTRLKASALKSSSDPRPTWDDVAAQYVKVFQEAINYQL